MSRKKFRFPTYHPPYDLPYAEYTPAASPHFYTKRKRGTGNPMDPYYRQPVVNLSGAQLRHSQYVFEDPYDFVAVNKPIDFYMAPGSANLHDGDDDLLEFYEEEEYGEEEDLDELLYLFGADEKEKKTSKWGKVVSFFKDVKLPKWGKKKNLTSEQKKAIIKKRKGKVLGWLGVKKLKRLLRRAKKGDPEAKSQLRAISKKARGRRKKAIVFPDSGKIWTAIDPKWKNKKGEKVQYTWDKRAKTIKYVSPSSGRVKVLKSTTKSYKGLLRNKTLEWKILIPEPGAISLASSSRGHEFLGKLASSAQATENAPEPAAFSNKFSQLAENSKLQIIQAMEQGAKLPLVVHGRPSSEVLKAQQELTERAKESEQTNENLEVQKKKSTTLLYATVGTGLVSLGVLSYLIINRKKGEHNATQ